jgi:hypothetical protein
VSTSAKVLLRGVGGPFTTAGTPLGTAGAGAATGASLLLRSSAHDFGAAGFGSGASITSWAVASDPGVGVVVSAAFTDPC